MTEQEIKRYTKEELRVKLELHKKWLNNEAGGIRLDLRDSNLRDSNLSNSDLSYTNLSNSDLMGSNLRGSDLDFASWPLWCGSIGVQIDERIAKQLVYHAICNMGKETMKKFLEDPIYFANGFHRVESGDVPRIEIE